MTEIISVELGRVFSEYRKQSSLCGLVCGMVVEIFLKFSLNNLWILSSTRHYDEGEREGAWWLWRESLWGNTGCCFLDFKQFRFIFEACLRSAVRWGRNRLFNFKAHEHFGKLIFVKYAVDLVLAWKPKIYHTCIFWLLCCFQSLYCVPKYFSNCKIHLRNNGTPLKLPIESFFFVRNAKPLDCMCKTSRTYFCYIL